MRYGMCGILGTALLYSLHTTTRLLHFRVYFLSLDHMVSIARSAIDEKRLENDRD